MSSNHLEVEGSVDVDVNGLKLSLVATGKDLTLDVDHPSRVIKSLGVLGANKKMSVRRLAQELHQRDMTLKISTRSKTMVVLGHAAKEGVASRLLGIPHLELRRNWSALKLLAG